MSVSSTTAPSKPPLTWTNVLVFSVTMLITLTVVPWYGFKFGFSSAAWIWFAVLLAANEMSVTAGYHRLWAHDTYQAHWSVRLAFMIFGAMAVQNSILIWASGHRTHHRFVDDNERDPYSANRGLWFSHIGWMLRSWPSGEPDFSNVRDLERDPIVVFQHRFYLPIVLATNFGIPLAIGLLVHDVWGVLLLAGFARLVASHHFTFFINSLAHFWGNQPYTDENTARDNHVLAVFTFGEGYHNFHHIFARDYRNGIRWWQWDPTKWLIRGLWAVGLTKKLHCVPSVTIERARLAMHFKLAEQKIAHSESMVERLHLERLRAAIAHEYDAFVSTMSEWSRRREEWYAEAKERLGQHWDQASRAYAREIERRLRRQRRRVHLLTMQLA
jgi:stearoyl-CoA desaturase (delta-9 desaturase)